MDLMTEPSTGVLNNGALARKQTGRSAVIPMITGSISELEWLAM